MNIHVSAFRWVPPFAQGYVRDLRVRWALEEAGLPYEATLIDPDVQASEAYREWQPFGQVPAFRDDAVEIFESGAIVLYLAARSEALAPADEAGRARMMTWVISALNSIEPFVQNLVQLDVFHAGEAWTVERRPQAEAMLCKHLAALGAWLGEREFLEDRFTAGDLMMTMVLRELANTGLLERYANLGAYVRRCTDRPAFRRALEAQLKPFRENEPTAI
ncbi:glutathione S-transferase family protein [Microvirga mediterraneensis]|uniref:Glutathione S-transferase family protein n=1 Tax=Microvirga mediterraneensis TaxID=2754695 RepID=A0A838BLZ3_9HYPH|nr:glutathione S-transferase family protein [Microvirga mediterraneensis]MBA1156351.1 glutathione S-transferase family protein [Microvirga mediterraneensis]